MAPTLTSPRGEKVTVPHAAVEFYTSQGWTIAGAAPQKHHVTVTPETTPEDTPDSSWTTKQLTAYAEHEHIDLGSATKKDDILMALAEGKVLGAAEGDVVGGDV